MHKRGLAVTQIFILLSSIIAFCFILNINFVNSEEWEIQLKGKTYVVDADNYNNAVKKAKSIMDQNELSSSPPAKTPPSAVLPTSIGYTEKFASWFTGKGNVGPKGTVFVEGKGWVDASKATLTDGITASTGSGYSTAGIIKGAAWAAGLVGITQFVAPLAGANSAQTNAISAALGVGTFTGTTINSLFGKGGYWQVGEKGLHAGWSTAIGVGVAAAIFLATYKTEETRTVTFECEPWQAPTGGSNCEKCNKGILPCSEYQCKSLGQSCELLNKGTDEEMCAWVNRKDVNPPVIKPRTESLLNNYVYSPDNTISPPDKGVKIQNNAQSSKCAEAFTPLTFGVVTNEPAQCKISPTRTSTFENMSYYFGGSNAYTYNHTQTMILPGADSLNASGLVLQNNGNFEMFVRCQDSNGNANTANFVFRYCVNDGPDTTPPLIVSTSLLNNMPISYGQTTANLNVYTNEPASCKWDFLDKAFTDMEETMTCASSITQVNSQMLYSCSTTLTGLKNEFNNTFYFRCKDTAENTNTESYKFNLIGTRPLVIDSVSPNNTVISDATDIIQVTLNARTSAGYKDGESACYYSSTNTTDSYVMFYNTNSYNHTQDLWLAEGNYTYYIKCLDLGGNTDQKKINFTLDTDSTSPLVVRAYHEGSSLKIVTNEKAECVYDTTSCSYTFDDGLAMNSADHLEHTAGWDSETSFYIKCKDQYGNQPLPDKCNIIAKPSDY